MKSITAIFLLLLLSWQLLFKTGYIIYWKANQSYITQQYCINKNKPKMHCNGKCHLMQELNKIEAAKEAKNNMPVSVLEIKSLDYFIINDYGFTLKILNFTTIHTDDFSFENRFLLSNGYVQQPYSPPEFI